MRASLAAVVIAATSCVTPAPTPSSAAPPSGAAETSQRDCRTEYPEEAKYLGIQGTVVLDLEVDEEGSVRSAKVLPGSPAHGLPEAAIKGLMGCKFRPAIKGGKPVRSKFIYRYTFELTD